MGAWDDLDAELGFKPKPAARVSSQPPKTVGAWDDLDAELSKPVPPRQVSRFGAFADDAIGAVKSIPDALSETATNAGNKLTATVVGAATKMAYPLLGIDRAQADAVAANLDSATEKLDLSKPSKPVDQEGLRKWANEYDATRRAIRDRFPVESRLGATDDQIDKLAADIVTAKQKPAQQQEIGEITPGSKVYKSPSNTTLHDVGANVGPMVRAASGKAAVGLLAAGAKKYGAEPIFDQAMRAYNMADDEVKTIGMQFGDETANARIFGAATSVAQNILPMMASAITRNPSYAIAPLTLQVAGDRTGEMLNKGYSVDDAVAHGVMFGLAEGIPERLSLGMFFKVFGPQKGAKQAAIALAEAYGTEIATENVTELTQFIIEKYSDKPELTLADLGKRLKETTIQTAIAAPVLIGGGIAAHKLGEAMQRGGAENRADDARQSAMSKLDTLQPKPPSAEPTGIWDDLDAELAGATPQPLPNNTAPALPQATIDAPAAQVPGQAVPEAPAVVDGTRDTNSVVDSGKPVGVTQAASDAIPAAELLDEEIQAEPSITPESAKPQQTLPASQSATQVESATPSAIERYQWNANKEGGQEYGNKQIIQPLTKELFDQYVADKSTYPSFEDFAADHPGQSIGLISQDNGVTWKPGAPFLGTQEELRPKPKNPAWVKQVDSFDSPEAVNHGSTADTVDRLKASQSERIPRGRGLLPVSDDRLKDSAITQELTRMAPDLPEKLNTKATIAAVNKAISGEPMTAKEKRVVLSMLDMAQEHVKPVAPDAIDIENQAERQAIIAEANDAIQNVDDERMNALLDATFNTEPTKGVLTNEEIDIALGLASPQAAGSGTQETDTEGTDEVDSGRGAPTRDAGGQEADGAGLTSYTNRDILDRERGPTREAVQAEDRARIRRESEVAASQFTLTPPEKPKAMQAAEDEAKRKEMQGDIFAPISDSIPGVKDNQGSGDNLTDSKPLQPGSEELSRDIATAKTFVSQIEALAEKHGKIYIRWSSTAKRDMDGEQQSRDFVSGSLHAGLSAVEVDAKTHAVDIAKSLSEYMFLRLQDPRAVPRVYLANRVGTDSDSHALIKPTEVLLEATESVIKAIDANFAELMALEDDIAKLEKQVERASGGGKDIVTRSLAEKRKQLARLSPNPSQRTQGADTLTKPTQVNEPATSLTKPEAKASEGTQDGVRDAAAPEPEKALNPVEEKRRAFELQDKEFYYSTGNSGMTSYGSFTADKSRWMRFSLDEALRMDASNIIPHASTKRGLFVGVDSGERLIRAPKPVTPQIISKKSAEAIISAAADSVGTLRAADVGRVLDETPVHYKNSMAGYIKENRRDLSDEVDSVLAEDKPVQQDSVTPEPQSEVDKAKAALDLAGVTGTARLTTIAAVNRGEITADDVAEAHGVDSKPITDFGQKIGGAKKDIWQSYKDKMDETKDVDIKAEPLSKSWPAPDYEALLESGADPYGVAFMRAARDEIPTKPSVGYKLNSWVEKVKMLRDFAAKIADGSLSSDRLRQELANTQALSGIAGRIELYMAVGHSQSLRGVSISAGSYGIYNGVEYSPPKIIWTVDKKAKATAFSNWPRTLAEGSTKEEALSNFKEKFASLEIDKPASRDVKFEVYATRGENGYRIGKKIGRNPIMLSEPFANVKEAREYMRSHQDELVKKLEAAKQIPNVRRDTNEPRIGEDMRDGKNVTPEMFMDAFGFRGVEFGNWVEQKKRQKDLNEAYDALMDMAAVIGVAPKALSLNGELGLAFGARGTGGIDPAKAHYEPGYIVINLTKKDGAGSIGHEWWHALDNYFSRMRGKKADYTTEALDVSLASRGSEFIANTAVRKEMIEAFGRVMRAIKSTALKARSAKLDAKRNKEYWTTGLEMSARAYESYLISKLQDQNASNDYLANIVSEQTWAAAEKMGFELEESYPYPTAGEVPAIREAFDHFFQTIETKETDQGIALLSLARGENFSPLSIGIAEATVARIGAVFSKKGWNVDLSLAATFDALPDEVKDAVAEYGEDTKVKGVVHKGVAYVVADEHGSEADLETTILHEVTGHVGVRRLYGKSITARLNDLYLSIGGRKGLSKIAAERGLTADLTEYAKMLGESEFSDEVRTRIMMEEVLSHIAQAPKFSDRVKSVIGAVRAWLRANGFAKLAEYGETDLLHIVSQGRAALATVETTDGPAVLMVADTQTDADVAVTAKFSRTDRSNIETAKRRIDKFVASFESGELKDSYTQIIGPTPTVLQALGADAQDIQIDGATVRKVLGGKHQHTMTPDMLRGAIVSIYDPLMVFNSPDYVSGADGKIIVTQVIDRTANPVIVAIHLSKRAGRTIINDVASVYGLEKANNRLRAEDLEYYKNEESLAPSTTPNLDIRNSANLAGVVQSAQDLGKSILTESDIVKSHGAGFSRSGTGEGMALRDLEAHIANLTSGYKNLPAIVSLQSVADAPQAVRDAVDQGKARDDVEGMYFNGKIYLFADHLNAARAEHVLLNHELAHYGLRGLFGSALNPVLHNIWATNIKVQARAAEFKKKFGVKDNVTATEEVLADMPESELVKLNGWQKMVFAVRDWLRGHGFTALADAIDNGLSKKLGHDAKADMEVARLVRAARAYAKDGKATRNTLSGVRFGKDATWRDVVAAWKSIGSDMAAYQNPTPDSFDMAGAAREIDPGMQAVEDRPDLDEQRDMKLARKWSVKMPDGTMASIYENEQGEVWINAANLAEGVSGGTKLYLLVGSYAEANGKVFIGDPAGLSDVALLRRTENMLSLALRFGRTDFMMPHEYQMNPEAKLDTVLKDVARPIEWVVGDDENNLAELLKTSYANTVNLVPEIKDVTYNFDKQRFERDGNEFGDEQFRKLASGISDSIRQRGFGRVLGHKVRDSGRAGGETRYLAPIGSATLKRAAITNTVSRAARGGAGRDVLAGISGLVSGGLGSTPLRKILYSRQGQLPVATGQPPAPPTRQTPLGLQGGSSSNTPTWDAPISTGLDDIAYKLQNKNIDLKRVIQSIKEAGRAIPDKFDPYLQEELFHKRAAKRTEDFVERELNPLLRDAKLRDLTLDEIDQYLHARHAEEANKLVADRNPGVQSLQDGGSGMKTADAKAYLAGLTAGKRKSLESVAAKVDAIIATTRNLYASYGLESANTVQEWAEMFDHYVPLMREDHDGGMGIGQGFSIKGREVKHRTGSTAAVVDILANIAMQREKVIVRGEKNRVAVALAGLAKLNPNSEFWEVGRIPTEQVLNEKTGVVETRPDPMFKSRENAIVAKISDGKGGVQEIAVLFNERNDRAMRMAASLKNLDAAQLEGWIGVFAKITRYFASINTQYNPVFGVVNLIRDYQGAVLNLAGTPLAKHKAAVMNPLTVMSALKGIYLDTRAERKGGMALSQWAQLWEEFNLEGGTTGYRDLFRTSADRANAIEHTLDPTKWMDSGLGKIFTAGGTLKVPMAYAQKKAEWLFDWLSDYNLAMENAVRLSAYKAAKEQGLSNQRAASLAKNLTVNFNRKGQLGQQAGALYAFFNASMQGTARIAETVLTMDNGDIKTLRLSKPGAVIVGGGVMLGVMQALMLAAAGFDDDEPPEFVRERSLVIPIGNKKYVAIPMPLGYHVLPNLGRVPTELILRGGRDAGEHALNLIGTIIGAFNPTGSAGMSWQTVAFTPLDPFVALTENRDWTGKPIARQSFNKATPGHALAKDTATHPGRWIAEAINYVTGGDKYTRGSISPTPDQIDYLGAQLGGGVLRELGKVNQSVSSAFTGEELPPHKIPLVGRFYGDAEGAASHGAKFYKNVEHLNELEAAIKGMKQDGTPIEKYKAEHPEADLIAYANGAERSVSKLRKNKRELIEKGAPRDEVKAVEARITAIMKKLNDRFREVRQ